MNLFDAGVDASWEVDIFGARRASIAGARADFARERSLRRLTLVTVAAEVVLAYTDVRGTQARLAVARDNVANQESASRAHATTADGGSRYAARRRSSDCAARIDTGVHSTAHRRRVVCDLPTGRARGLRAAGAGGRLAQSPIRYRRRRTRSRSESRLPCCAGGRTWQPPNTPCSRRRLAPASQPPNSSRDWY